MPFRRTEQDIIQPVITARGQYKQVMTKIPLTLRSFLHQLKTVLARLYHLVRDSLAAFLRNSFDMRHDAVDVLLRVRTVVMRLEQDDMRARLTRQIGAYLRLVGLFFKHRDRYQQSVERLDRHRARHEYVRTPLLAALVQMSLDNPTVVLALNQPYIVVIVPNHFSQCVVSIVWRY